jgi:hypothetical protein
MKNVLAAAVVSAFFAMPAMAQDVTCADFTAMDAEAQAEAFAALQEDNSGAAQGNDAAATDMTSEALVEACTDTPDVSIRDAMMKSMEE